MPDRNRPAQKLTHDFFPNSNVRRLMEISSYMYTGPHGSKTQPGVGFELLVSQDALSLDPVDPQLRSIIQAYREVEIEGQKLFRIDVGVMDRDAARRLHELLGQFLADFPEEA